MALSRSYDMRLARINVIKQSENSQRRRTNSAEHRGKPVAERKKVKSDSTEVKTVGSSTSINIPTKSRGREEYKSPIASPLAVQSSPMKIRSGYFHREVGVGSLTDSFGEFLT